MCNGQRPLEKIARARHPARPGGLCRRRLDGILPASLLVTKSSPPSGGGAQKIWKFTNREIGAMQFFSLHGAQSNTVYEILAYAGVQIRPRQGCPQYIQRFVQFASCSTRALPGVGSVFTGGEESLALEEGIPHTHRWTLHRHKIHHHLLKTERNSRFLTRLAPCSC